MKDERGERYLIIEHPLRVRHATEDDLSSDEWHLYTQFIACGYVFIYFINKSIITILFSYIYKVIKI